MRRLFVLGKFAGKAAEFSAESTFSEVLSTLFCGSSLSLQLIVKTRYSEENLTLYAKVCPLFNVVALSHLTLHCKVYPLVLTECLDQSERERGVFFASVPELFLLIRRRKVTLSLSISDVSHCSPVSWRKVLPGQVSICCQL